MLMNMDIKSLGMELNKDVVKKGQTEKGDKRSNLEQDEILYYDLFEFRKKGAITLCFIDQIYEMNPSYKKYIKRYKRNLSIQGNTDLMEINKFMSSSSSFQKKYSEPKDNKFSSASILNLLPFLNQDSTDEEKTILNDKYFEAFIILKGKYKRQKGKINCDYGRNHFYKEVRESSNVVQVADFMISLITKMKVSLNFKNYVDYNYNSGDPTLDKAKFEENFWLNNNFKSYIIF